MTQRLTTLAGLAVLAGSAQAAVVFSDNFDGASSDLNGVAPDVAPGAETWVAAESFNADGSVEDTAGASATLAFSPVDGMVYTLDASMRNFAATATATATENDWLAVGFANGQSSAISTNSRFVSGDVNGIAWTFMRGGTTASVGNRAFLGTAVSGTQLNTGSIVWSDAGLEGSFAADIDYRIVLDTTGGAGTWTATWYAKLAASATYTEIVPTTLLVDESINSIGFARSNTGFTADLTNLTLTAVPEPGSLALLGIGGLAALRRRR